MEKKFISFQLLCVLHQCHKMKVCHGDIKWENVMVTSWNWLLLTDFARFKPTFLPEDNPADFSYFFDTSRRRTCYLAPERFVRGTSATSEGEMLIDAPNMMILPDADSTQLQELTPEMDIFSAGQLRRSMTYTSRKWSGTCFRSRRLIDKVQRRTWLSNVGKLFQNTSTRILKFTCRVTLINLCWPAMIRFLGLLKFDHR